ncbi:PKD domain-containing protein [Kribbella sp. NPDC056345]|uniref:PKD domain-containing protein n=1 Tax=Kribbella sp. NPDC056345 TaxID=3345789 RepID=UPI0035DB2AC1
MKASAWGFAAVTGAAALCLPSLAAAINEQAVSDQVLTEPVTRVSPPPVTGKKTHAGLKVHGTKNKQSRLQTGQRPAPNGSTSRKGKTPKSHANRPRKPVKILKQGVRLNTGLCGRVQPDGSVPGPDWCQPVVPGRPVVPERATPPPVVRPRPEDVTWDQVFTESKDVLFKKLTVYVQPKGKTLVNLETIVYTDKTGVLTYPVVVAGFRVIVKATPSKYIWSFGDGSSKSTYSAGSPYPSKEITHRYLKRGDVRLSVTVEYAASFSVAGLEPQFVGPVPITGPSTPLQVREAVPVLVDPPR